MKRKLFQDGKYLEGLYAERRGPEQEGLEIQDRKAGKAREQGLGVDGRDSKHRERGKERREAKLQRWFETEKSWPPFGVGDKVL